MSSWQDLPASVDVEWQQWLASDALDPDLGQSQIPQRSDSSTKYDTSQRASSGNFATVGSLAHNHLAVAAQTTHAFIAGAPQYRAPQAIQQLPLDAGWRVPGQDDGFRNTSHNANRGAVPRTRLVGFDYQQQTPGVSRPGARSVWMGRDYALDGFVPLVNMGTVPALMCRGPFHIEPLPLALQAPLPTPSGINPAMQDWTQHELQYSFNASTIAQGSGTQSHRFHGGMQVPGTYREPGITRPSVIAESRAVSSTFLLAQAISSPSLQAPQIPLCTPIHARAVPSTLASTTGTSPLATAPTARRRTKWHGGSYGRNRDFENYLPSLEPLPPGLSGQEICGNYPNHLHGETLLRVVYGQGDEQGVWKARKIWAECPADGRGNVSKYGRPHNYLEAAIRRAEQDALQDGRAVQQQGKRKRRRHEPVSDNIEEGQICPLPKRARIAKGSSSPYSNISSTEVQGVQGQTDGRMNLGAASQASGSIDSVQNGEEIEIDDIMPNRLPQRGHDPIQNGVASALDQPRAMTLSAPETKATIIGKTRQPAVDAAIAAFKDALRQESSYQHRLIRELNPDIDKLSAEKQQEQVRKIWMTEYGRWEQRVKISYDLELGSPVQDRANISALLNQVFEKVVAENAIEAETEHDALVLKAWTSIFSGCTQAIKDFREYYAGRFVIEQTQTAAAPGASTLSKAESTFAFDDSRGNGPSIPATTSPRSVQRVEAASQNSNMLLTSARDSFKSSSVEQPRVVLAVPAVPIPCAESFNIGPSRLRKQDSGPGPKKGPPKAAQEVEDGSRAEGSSVRHLKQVDKDAGLDHVLEFGPNQVAGVANDYEYTFEVASPAETADPRSNRDVAHFEEGLLAQQDHDDEQVSTNSIEVANEATLGRVQSAKEGSTEQRISSIASKPAKRARKINAHLAVQSTRNVAAATVAAAPSPAELEAQATLQAEMAEAAFRRAEELGASREWIEAQTITGRDDIGYRVEPHDVINWHEAYRGSGQPVTENDAHAAVKWVKDGCPRVHGRFTENSKERRYRVNQERRE